MQKNFNPSGVGVRNGNFFGFPCSINQAEMVIITIPWDATASYRKGTSKGPQAMIEASVQLDFYDHLLPSSGEMKIATDNDDSQVYKLNRKTRVYSKKLIDFLENGGNPESPKAIKMAKPVEKASEWLNRWVYNKTRVHLESGRKVIAAGGEHSVPLGMYHALTNHYGNFGILHLDAHADLRNAYEGFTFSHASIMYNALQIAGIEKIIQVGIRDYCIEEVATANRDSRVVQFPDYQLKNNEYKGITWDEQCNAIIGQLPQKVHISFDIDALEPSLCSATGTPVPGGLTYTQAVYLMEKLALSGKEIISCDLCEVAPSDNETDQNIGARLLFKMCCLIKISEINAKK